MKTKYVYFVAGVILGSIGMHLQMKGKKNAK